MATGTVKWFNSVKGFGFIKPDGGGGDVFVRPPAATAAGLQESDEGKKVSYKPVDSEGGTTSATNIKLRTFTGSGA